MDPTTRRLVEQGIIKIDNGGSGDERSAIRRLKDFGMVTYDFWSGVKYLVVLSALLWWLPLFGPMLAGYVGGRRTGGPKKGLFASIIALGLIGVVHIAVNQALLPTEFDAWIGMPAAVVASAYEIQALAPYVEFLQLYWTSFYSSVMGGLPYSPNSYVLTAVFAYIGGVISVDKQRELSKAMQKDSPSVTIDLSKTISERSGWSRSGSSNRPVNTVAEAKRRSEQHLQDLKKIQFHRGEKQKKSKPGAKYPSRFKRFEDLPRSMQKRRPPVRHHSMSDGDDWEIL